MLNNIIIALILSLVPAATMTYIAVSHNAMMEFCEGDPEASTDCVIDIQLALFYFSAWYLFSFIVFLSWLFLFTLLRRN